MPESVITRLLDYWWDWKSTAPRRKAERRARRASLRPLQLPIDLGVPVHGYPLCTCGHPANPHRHHRDGTDCSMCSCRSYTARRITHA
jgi:hypothetical protein